MNGDGIALNGCDLECGNRKLWQWCLGWRDLCRRFDDDLLLRSGGASGIGDGQRDGVGAGIGIRVRLRILLRTGTDAVAEVPSVSGDGLTGRVVLNGDGIALNGCDLECGDRKLRQWCLGRRCFCWEFRCIRGRNLCRRFNHDLLLIGGRTRRIGDGQRDGVGAGIGIGVRLRIRLTAGADAVAEVPCIGDDGFTGRVVLNGDCTTLD